MISTSSVCDTDECAQKDGIVPEDAWRVCVLQACVYTACKKGQLKVVQYLVEAEVLPLDTILLGTKVQDASYQMLTPHLIVTYMPTLVTAPDCYIHAHSRNRT
jgi:hypothetical protein